MNGRAYSPTDDAVIRRYAGTPGGMATAAKMLNRTIHSVISRSVKLRATRLPRSGHPNQEETPATTARDDRMMAIYRMICDHPGVTVRDIADATGYPFADVKEEVEHLMKETLSNGYSGKVSGPPPVICENGRLRQNLDAIEHPEPSDKPGILVFRTGFDGGRVNKRRM